TGGETRAGTAGSGAAACLRLAGRRARVCRERRGDGLRVLVIPEDFRKDQYVLKPIIEAMMHAAGRPQAKVRVCRDPLLRGVAQALHWQRIAEIIERYAGMTDLFLLCVDRDGDAGRRT